MREYISWVGGRDNVARPSGVSLHQSSSMISEPPIPTNPFELNSWVIDQPLRLMLYPWNTATDDSRESSRDRRFPLYVVGINALFFQRRKIVSMINEIPTNLFLIRESSINLWNKMWSSGGWFEKIIENLSVVGVNALFFQGPHEKRKKVTKCEGTVRGMAVHIDSYWIWNAKDTNKKFFPVFRRVTWKRSYFVNIYTLTILLLQRSQTF